jgi:hypothetical protein
VANGHGSHCFLWLYQEFSCESVDGYIVHAASLAAQEPGLHSPARARGVVAVHNIGNSGEFRGRSVVNPATPRSTS